MSVFKSEIKIISLEPMKSSFWHSSKKMFSNKNYYTTFTWKKQEKRNYCVTNISRKRKARNARLRIRLLAAGLMRLITCSFDCREDPKLTLSTRKLSKNTNTDLPSRRLHLTKCIKRESQFRLGV